MYITEYKKKQKDFVRFQYCRFILPSCQFLAAFKKLFSPLSPQPLFRIFLLRFYAP